MSSFEVVARRKRSLDTGGEKQGETTLLCSFCQATPAAVMVPMPSLRFKKGKPIPTPFCLLHYYTTSACRVGIVAGESRPNNNDGGVTVINESALHSQLAPQQELFAEAFVQLQQELQEAAMQQYATHKNDPLAILADLNKSSSSSKQRRRSQLMKAPPPRANAPESPEGGFLREVPVPERLLRTQKQQHQQQQELIARMNRATDTTQRRKPTRRSVWNVMLDDDRKPSPAQIKAAPVEQTIDVLDNDRTCSCGSDKVETVSSNSSDRNQDMAKAETWGTKDRGGEIVTKYRCTVCGKIWNEEE